MATSNPPVTEQTRLRLLEEYKQGAKMAISVLNELGYKPNQDYKFVESDREVGETKTKMFTCRVEVAGLRSFPAEESLKKKGAREAAAKHLAGYLLKQKSVQAVDLEPSPVSPISLASSSSRLVSDGGKESQLKKQFKDGIKTPASVLSELATFKGWPQPKTEEVYGAGSGNFCFVCSVGSQKFDIGTGLKKQDAKQDAARKALNRLFTDAPAIPSPVLEPKFSGSKASSISPPGGAGGAVGGADTKDGKRKLRNDEADEEYPMDTKPRGFVLIVNNVTIKGEEPRHGSDKDVKRLTEIFTKRGYQVLPLQQYKDLSSSDMKKKIKAFAKKDEHNTTSCSILFILSHGRNGCVLGSDGEEVPIDDIINMFHSSNAPALAGKPKFFGIQACRGVKWDSLATDGASGGLVVADATTRAQSRQATLQTDHFTKMGKCIPEFADLCVVYATNPGLVSWRYEDTGSIFVQAFCDVMSNNDGKDIHRILTRVNKRVSDFEDVAPKGGKTHKVKQVSDCRHTLCKDWIP